MPGCRCGTAGRTRRPRHSRLTGVSLVTLRALGSGGVPGNLCLVRSTDRSCAHDPNRSQRVEFARVERIRLGDAAESKDRDQRGRYFTDRHNVSP